MKSWNAAVVALAVGTLGINGARAESALWAGERAMATSTGPEGFFFTAGAEVARQQLPRWNSPVSLFQFAVAANIFLSNFSPRPEVTGAGPALGIGYTLREGTLPPWLGSRVRIGIVGGFSSSSSTDRRDYPFNNGGILTFSNLNGTSTGFVAFTNVQPVFEELRVFRDSWNIGLRAASDFALGNDLVFTPQLTFYGGQTTDTYNWHLVYANLGVLHSVNERIRTRELGGDFAAALSWRPLSWLVLSASGRVGVVSQSSEMTGSDCFAAPGCTPGSPQSQSVSDSRSVIALRTGGSLGVGFDAGGVMLSMSGFVTHDSKVPGIVNPAFFVTPPPRQQPAHIHYQSGLRYGGMVSLRIPLFTGF